MKNIIEAMFLYTTSGHRFLLWMKKYNVMNQKFLKNGCAEKRKMMKKEK